MNTLIKCILTLIVLLGLGKDVVAQDGTYVTVRDLEMWSSAKVNYKFNKKVTFSLEEQLRLNDDASRTDQYFTEFSLKNEFAKSFYWGLGSRFIRNNDTKGKIQGFENHMRFNLDFGFKHDFKSWDFKYQFRYQTKNELGISKAEGDVLNNQLRFKMDVDYNIKKWKFDPKVSAEIFRKSGAESGFNKFRWTVGTEYSINKHHDVGLFYRMDRELNVSYPLTSNIIGIEYTYTIKRKK